MTISRITFFEYRPPPIKIFIFDIDETLITTGKETELLPVNATPKEHSSYNIYRGYNIHDMQCMTLNKAAIKKIMGAIHGCNNVIGVITAGGYSAKDIRLLFAAEYEISLDNDFPFFSRAYNKASCLQKIAERYAISPGNIALIDNDKYHISAAKAAGFYTIYADNNPSDPTDGRNHIKALTQLTAAYIPQSQLRHNSAPNSSIMPVEDAIQLLEEAFESKLPHPY